MFVDARAKQVANRNRNRFYFLCISRWITFHVTSRFECQLIKHWNHKIIGHQRLQRMQVMMIKMVRKTNFSVSSSNIWATILTAVFGFLAAMHNHRRIHKSAILHFWIISPANRFIYLNLYLVCISLAPHTIVLPLQSHYICYTLAARLHCTMQNRACWVWSVCGFAPRASLQFWPGQLAGKSIADPLIGWRK